MLDTLMSFVAPHYCSGCAKIGTALCDNCKYDITGVTKTACLLCQKLCGESGVCKDCKKIYQRAWCVGERTGVLQRIIGLYKFERLRSGYRVLGDLLLDRLPELPVGTVIIPIPTVTGHIRERGYDHMMLIAKYVARKRNLTVSVALRRKTNTKQRQATAKQRTAQAKNAFEVSGALNPDTTYLLIDDVVTTGATIKYAGLALKNAGARQIWAAAVARQVLD